MYIYIYIYQTPKNIDACNSWWNCSIGFMDTELNFCSWVLYPMAVWILSLESFFTVFVFYLFHINSRYQSCEG